MKIESDNYVTFQDWESLDVWIVHSRATINTKQMVQSMVYAVKTSIKTSYTYSVITVKIVPKINHNQNSSILTISTII